MNQDGSEMLIYDVLAGVFGVAAGALILASLIDAARTRRARWVMTILLLPVVGAIGWWVAGRRAYQLPDPAEADPTA